ncbi:MAG: histidine kinase, partial [Clostridia bacterium]|nr:histidine kinase [Clostridia bacterium]
MAKKQTGIRRRFMSMLFGATAVFLLIIFVIVNISVLQSQLQKREKDAETRVAYIANAINDELNSALDVSNNITQNELITDILAEGPGDSMEHVMEAYSFIRKHFSAFTQYGRNMNRQIRIYPVDTKFPGGKYIYRLDALRESPVWEDMEAMKPYESVWNFANIDNTPTVSLYRKINSGDELLGYLEIQIPFYWIKNILTKTELTSGERLEYKNNRGEILYESSAENRGKVLDFAGELANRDVVTLSIDRGTLIGENIIFILTSALVFIVLLFAIWFLSRYFVYSLTDELNSFISELNRDEEALLSLSLTEEDKGGSELYEIKKKFIMLIGRVSEMHNDIEKINLEKKKIEMEYLQMSFNPHLLYNSLSTLNWILRKTNRPDMVELVDHMTEYYRSV